MSDDRNILVCCRVTPQKLHPPVADALQKACAFCQAAVWASPASIATIAEHAEEFDVCCIECAPSRVPRGAKVMRPSAGQIGEISRELRRRASQATL